MVPLQIIRGDATSPQAKGPKVVAHVCNDIGGWGRGFVLAALAGHAERLGASVHMPRIGCGLAGGRWERVEPLVVAALCARDIPTTVYDHD